MEILTAIKNWLIHLFTYHCDACLDEAAAKSKCLQCDEWKQLYLYERQRRTELEDMVMNPKVVVETPPIETSNPIDISRRGKPWHVMRQQLEKKDHEEYLASIEKLEKETGVSDAIR
jgi:hypothetical protein